MGAVVNNPSGIDMARWAWQERAACNAAPMVDQLGFTSPAAAGRGGKGRKARLRDLSKRYCDKCPVLAECYAWAQADEYFIGIAAARQWTQEQRYAQQHARQETQYG